MPSAYKFSQKEKACPMKMKILSIAAVVLVAFAATAWAANVAGKWAAEQPGRQGGVTVTTFDFKVEGNKLTGTMQRGEQEPVEISEGKVEGDNVSFAVVRSFGGNEMKIVYKGTVSGDELKLTPEMQGGMGMGGPGAGGPPPGFGGPGAGGPPPGVGGPGAGGPPPGGGGPGGGGGFSREIIAKRVK